MGQGDHEINEKIQFTNNKGSEQKARKRNYKSQQLLYNDCVKLALKLGWAFLCVCFLEYRIKQMTLIFPLLTELSRRVNRQTHLRVINLLML